MKDNSIIGAKIVDIRRMTKAEASKEGWEHDRNDCMVLVLDNGIKMYPSRDYEGNGSGALFYMDKGKPYAI
tara:strand:+ start:226 stop:438 length:213 start_codon:yes stop_codon:yes gene_type:complete